MSARGAASSIVAFHRRLQRADRIDFRDHDAAARLAQAGGRALADVAEARDHRHLARHHHVGAAADAVDQRFAAAIEVVEFRLGDGIVDVDRREQQPAVLLHLVEAVDAGGGLLGDAADRGALARVPAGALLVGLQDRGVEDLLLLVGRLRDQRRILLRAHAQMDQQRGVAAVVQDHVRRAAIGPFEDAVGVVPVVHERLALDREDRRAAGRDRRGGVVLGRVDVARRPAHVGAQRLQRLDQHRGLDRHVQRAGDARALEGLRRAVFGADRHQTGHLGLRHRDLLAAPFGEVDVGDAILGSDGHRRLLGRDGTRGRQPVRSARDISAP
jgi:hypothetical protein